MGSQKENPTRRALLAHHFSAALRTSDLHACLPDPVCKYFSPELIKINISLFPFSSLAERSVSESVPAIGPALKTIHLVFSQVRPPCDRDGDTIRHDTGKAVEASTRAGLGGARVGLG